MSRRVVIDCDACPAADIGEAAEFTLYVPRQPGEMEGGHDAYALCHRCSVRLVTALAKSNNLEPKFPAIVAGLRTPKGA